MIHKLHISATVEYVLQWDDRDYYKVFTVKQQARNERKALKLSVEDDWARKKVVIGSFYAEEEK